MPALVAAGHRYLLAEPCQSGNPVFSIYQSDVIAVWAGSADVFLREFAWPLGPDEDRWEREATTQQRQEACESIPFRGQIYQYNN